MTSYNSGRMLIVLQGQARISDQESQRLQTLYDLLRRLSA